MERLSPLIEDAISLWQWTPITIGWSGSALASLIFIGDLVPFVEADVDQAQAVK